MPEPSVDNIYSNNDNKDDSTSEINNEVISSSSIDNETQQFMNKIMAKCNKYRSNTKNEINKMKKVTEELSVFLSINSDELSKAVKDYKDEMINSGDNTSCIVDNELNAYINNADIIPSPPNEN